MNNSFPTLRVSGMVAFCGVSFQGILRFFQDPDVLNLGAVGPALLNLGAVDPALLNLGAVGPARTVLIFSRARSGLLFLT